MAYNRVEKFKNITESMLDLYTRKNSDYGNSVADTFDRFGLESFLVRLYDKLNRATQLSQKGYEQKVVDEKIEDTLMDMANYSIMALIEMDRAKSEKCQIASADDYGNR